MVGSTEGRRTVRIAAVGDVHFDGSNRGPLRELLAEANNQADVLVFCGDLTTHGKVDQMHAFAEELAGIDIPKVGVLGNHDYEAGEQVTLSRILCDAGVEVLDGTHTIIAGVGFAGTKGFAGGFGRGALGPFGEQLIKSFVDEAVQEALKIEKAMRHLDTEARVVVLHYSPVIDTVIGEPEMIFPFLGSSRLVQPIDTLGASVVFHGHAHHGTFEGKTQTGIPVFNVSWPLLRAGDSHFLLYEIEAPDRRQAAAELTHTAPGTA